MKRVTVEQQIWIMIPNKKGKVNKKKQKKGEKQKQKTKNK